MSNLYRERINSRIRKEDYLLQEYFSLVKDSDYPHEIRRLLEIGIVAEESLSSGQINLIKKIILEKNKK